MADTLIKTVRVRRNPAAQISTIEGYGALDLKVSLYKTGLFGDKRKVSVTDSKNNSIPGKDSIEYVTNGRYSEFTDNDYIREYIDTLAKIQPPNKITITTSSGEKPVYDILQDPWQDNAPLTRNFGNSPYYMNDGSIVTIKWFRKKIGNAFEGAQLIEEGGVEWSNKSSKSDIDLELDKIIRDEQEITISSKKIYIKTTNGKLTPAWKSKENRELKPDNIKLIAEVDLKSEDEVSFSGREKDNNLLSLLKEIWTLQLESGDYNLKKCNPDYDSCDLDSNQRIDFRDPIEQKPDKKSQNTKSDESIKSTDGSKTNASGTKVKLTVKLPDDFKAQANKDIPKFNIFVGDVLSDIIYKPIENDGYSDSGEELDEEYKEIEFIYTEPSSFSKDEIPDPNDESRGLPDEETVTKSETVVNEPKKSTISQTGLDRLKEIVKQATLATGPGPGGKCARFTFNHANNFVRSLMGSDTQACTKPAGGNANQEGYHSALQKLGYKRIDQGTVTKSDIKSSLANKSNWDIGDVVAYWGITSNSKWSEEGGVKYGHTQMFTEANHGGGKNKARIENIWTSDDVGNFGTTFVYNKYEVDKWRYIIFKSPATYEDGKKKLGIS